MGPVHDTLVVMPVGGAALLLYNSESGLAGMSLGRWRCGRDHGALRIRANFRLHMVTIGVFIGTELCFFECFINFLGMGNASSIDLNLRLRTILLNQESFKFETPVKSQLCSFLLGTFAIGEISNSVPFKAQPNETNTPSSFEEDGGTRIRSCFRDELDDVEDEGWICFLGNNSSGTKKYQGSNSSDGGNTGDEVKIAGGVIGSGGEIGFSEELKELLPAEAGK
ncbi:hypothetical protein Tco_1291839 [Tanacetum coccineum]